MAKKYCLIVIACALSFLVNAQEEQKQTIAELQQVLKSSSSDLNRCNTMLDLALAYVLKPGEYAKDLDSAGLLINQAEVINNARLNSKTVEAKAYFTYAILFREKGDRIKGKSFCEKSIDSYKKLPASDALGEAYFELANYYEWFKSKEQGIKRACFSNGLAAFTVTGNKNRQGFALKNMADIDFAMRNNGQALVELQQALEIYKSINYPDLQGVYDLLGSVYNYLGDYTSAVKYGLLAVRTCEEVNDTSLQLCTICYRLGIAYDNGNRNHSYEAVVYLQRAFDIAVKYNDSPSIYLTISALANVLGHVGREREAVFLMVNNKDKIKMEDRTDSVLVYSCFLQTFTRGGEPELAKAAANTLINLLPDVVGPANEATERGFRALVAYFLSNHQSQLAEKYADLNLAYSIGDPQYKSIVIAAYKYKAQADSATGDFVSAFKNQQIYTDLKDSLFNEQKSYQFTQMQVAFETEKKDNELKILQAKNDLNNAELQRSRQIRNSIIGGAIVLLLLFYTGYRFKQRSNARLQTKQEEINQQNDRLKHTIGEKNQLLMEKEWLLKEIHHRVKNNLQIVISLLNTQSHYIDNDEAITAITESQHRMEAMSLIHQKLYQSENTTSVDMKIYIDELREYLEASFNTEDKIIFTLAVEPIEIDIAQAIPLGLILNETITNSIKYAFAGHVQGTIAITMTKKQNDLVLLEIKDNGRGLPANFDIAKSDSMGMRLISGLANQIEGELSVSGEHGVTTSILFRQHFITDDM